MTHDEALYLADGALADAIQSVTNESLKERYREARTVLRNLAEAGVLSDLDATETTIAEIAAALFERRFANPT